MPRLQEPEREARTSHIFKADLTCYYKAKAGMFQTYHYDAEGKKTIIESSDFIIYPIAHLHGITNKHGEIPEFESELRREKWGHFHARLKNTSINNKTFHTFYRTIRYDSTMQGLNKWIDQNGEKFPYKVARQLVVLGITEKGESIKIYFGTGVNIKLGQNEAFQNSGCYKLSANPFVTDLGIGKQTQPGHEVDCVSLNQAMPKAFEGKLETTLTRLKAYLLEVSGVPFDEDINDDPEEEDNQKFQAAVVAADEYNPEEGKMRMALDKLIKFKKVKPMDRDLICKYVIEYPYNDIPFEYLQSAIDIFEHYQANLDYAKAQQKEASKPFNPDEIPY